MEYFLGRDEIDKYKASNFEGMPKSAAKFTISPEDVKCFSYCDAVGTVKTVKHRTLLSQSEQITKKFKLPSIKTPEMIGSSLLKSTTEDAILWKERIQLLIEEERTLLSIVDDNNEFIKFNDGDNSVHFHYVFTEVFVLGFNENYLVILTGTDFDDVERHLIIVDIKEINSNNKIVKEVFRQNLNEGRNINAITKVIFNTTVPKILFLSQIKNHVLLKTFDIKSLKFSSTVTSQSEYNDPANIVYGYHNILKDIIVVVTSIGKMVTVFRESLQSGLYIYKQSKLNLEYVNSSHCCINRSNSVVLFIHAIGNSGNSRGIYVYDVINEKISPKPFWNANSDIFSNPSGEEIIVSEENEINVFVYKSRIQSLKYICQVAVLDRYSKEELGKMNLPKTILENR